MSSTSLNTKRDTILKGALRLVGAYASTGLPKPQQLEDANEALNMFIKNLQTKRLLWLKEFVTLFVESGKASYTIPSSVSNPTYGAPDDDLYSTSLGADALSAAVNLTVDSTSDITALDIIGIYLDDNTLHWDTVASVDSGTTLTLTTGLSGAASDGNTIYNYRYNGGLKRPTEITTMTRIESTGNESPIMPLSRSDYAELTYKSTAGVPVQLYYDRQQDTGVIYLWPVPNSETLRIKMTFDRPIEVPTDSTDDFDFPDEYMELLKYGTAVRIAPEYAVPIADQQLLAAGFASLLEAALADEIEDVSLYMQPDRSF